MSTTTLHPDDRPSDFDGRLWDADPTVCCAAFQLGACAHSEVEDDDDMSDAELAEMVTREQAELRIVLALVAPAPPEPF